MVSLAAIGDNFGANVGDFIGKMALAIPDNGDLVLSFIYRFGLFLL